MKRKGILLLLILCLTTAIFFWLGVGSYSSSSAVLDLQAELEAIYGSEYTGKAVPNGVEDMIFEIEPRTRFLTNWNLRNTLGLDYQYECRVIFTTCTKENAATIRTITYQASDPMGTENISRRATLDLTSKTEITEVR